MFGPGLSFAVSFRVSFAKVLQSIFGVFVNHLFQTLTEGKENALVLVCAGATWSIGTTPSSHPPLANGEQKKAREVNKWKGRDVT